MPAKKQDVAPEEMAPQAEEKLKKLQKNLSLTQSLKMKAPGPKVKAFQRENAHIPDRQ